MTSNLYKSPFSTPSTKSAHTPVPGMSCMACCSAFQALKSPTTRTSRAFGAQTAKRVPRMSGRSESRTVITIAPSRFQHSLS
jgi:hypothetical protein